MSNIFRLINSNTHLLKNHHICRLQLFVSDLSHHSRICCGHSYSTSADDDYEFLQRSIVPTMHFQPSLPRLPIPELPKTCERYLIAQRPLLADEEYKQTEKAVLAFKEGIGKELHDELVAVDKSNKHTSYISDYWFDMYLSDRQPIVLNYNPFISFVDDPNPAQMGQLTRATNMVVSAARFLKSQRAGILEPEVFHLNPKKSDTKSFRKVMSWLPSRVSWYGAFLYKVFPLDMSQFASLFNSTRIPCYGKDELLRDETAGHLVVMRNGNFYAFDILDKDGHILPPDEIHACLAHILADRTPTPAHPLGYLTTENRNTWASVREKLMVAGNHEALRLVDTAVFTLCLDNESVTDPVEMVKTFIHGDAANRWFDKSFSLIVCKNGKAGLNFEHSWGDGVAVLRFFNELFKDTTQRPRVHPGSPPAKIDPTQRVSRVEFVLSDALKQDVDGARARFHNFVNTLGIHLYEFPNINKAYVKKHKLSPDSLMQLAIQMAYYRQTGRTTATYESCSTSAFRKGRTETVRSATMATKECCEAFGRNPRPGPSELRGLIDNCSKVHNQLVKEAAMGHGFDRHLYAMRRLAEAHGRRADLYDDPAYAALNHNILSTSTLSAVAVEIGGFAPVVADGFGVGYGITDARSGLNLMSFPGTHDPAGFVDCFRASMDDMYAVLEAAKK